MEKKTDQRKRDEAAMKYAGSLGHTFFQVGDEAGGGSYLLGQYGSAESALRFVKPGERLYQKIGKGKYNLVG